MFELLEGLIDAIESALGTFAKTVDEPKGKNKFLASLKDKRSRLASLRPSFNPIARIKAARDQFVSRSMKTIKEGAGKTNKLLDQLNASESAKLQKTLLSLTKGQKFKALQIIKTLKLKNRNIKSNNSGEVTAALTKNTIEGLNQIFDTYAENNTYQVGEGVEFSALSSSWLASGIWRTTDNNAGQTIGNISLTTKSGATFTITAVPRELWYLMKNATGSYGHWYAPKGAGSWYWNYKKNGQITTSGLEFSEVRKYIQKTITAQGQTALILKRRSSI